MAEHQGAPRAGQAAPQPAPAKAAALNAKAEAAAAQPLPDSAESDAGDAPDGVKGIMRTGPAKENGTIANEERTVTSHVVSTCIVLPSL